jgi:cell division protein FtsX
MKKKPAVFSIMQDQSVFLTIILALLTFLSVLCLGITLSIGTAVKKWNAQWDTYSTIQILPNGDITGVRAALSESKSLIVSARDIPEAEVSAMLRQWLRDSDAMWQYLPKMIEVKLKSKRAVIELGAKVSTLNNVRYLTHSDAVRNITGAGVKIIGISLAVFAMILFAIAVSVSYIARNITTVHRRELEILNHMGAYDSFIANQMSKIMARISALASLIGFAVAAPVLLFIISMSRNVRFGLMAMIGLDRMGWLILAAITIGMAALSVYIARRTTLRSIQRGSGRVKQTK